MRYSARLAGEQIVRGELSRRFHRIYAEANKIVVFMNGARLISKALHFPLKEILPNCCIPL